MEIHLPLLEQNTKSSCPAEIKEIASYVSLENGGKCATSRIHFVRTAKIGKTKYWLFRAKPLNDKESWAVVNSDKFLFLFPTYCVATWGDPSWNEVEFLLRFHWMSQLKKPGSEFDAKMIPGLTVQSNHESN